MALCARRQPDINHLEERNEVGLEHLACPILNH